MARPNSTRRLFPLFQSPIDLAHAFWTQIVQQGDCVVDATCGNGWDTLHLCQLALCAERGQVYAFDIQKEAIWQTMQRLTSDLPQHALCRCFIEQRCHSKFPSTILPGTVKLIVYNLGYLPGGEKTKTTLVQTTLQSIRQALDLIQEGGVISITCYPGHEEGYKEAKEILQLATALCPREWSCCHFNWLNRNQSPSLLLIQRASNPTTER